MVNKAHFAKVADQNFDNFLAEGELRRVNIEAYLSNLNGQVISGADIQHISAEFAELSKNAQATVQITKQSFEQSVSLAEAHSVAEVSEPGDLVFVPPLSQAIAFCTPTPKFAPTPPGGTKRAGDDTAQDDSTMDGTDAMQTLAKAKRVLETAPSLSSGATS